MKTVKLGRFAVLAPVLAAATILAVQAPAGDRKPMPMPKQPKEMTFSGLRGVEYCEVWLFSGTPKTGLTGVYYNTSGLNKNPDKMLTCPPALWAKVTTKALEARYDVSFAFKNGPRLWTMDTIKIPVGPVVNFDGVEARWWGQGKTPKGVDFKGGVPPYHPLKSYRKSTFTFEKGKPVFILEDDKGTPWVMQALCQIDDPKMTYGSLKTLGDRLKNAKGWKYRVVTLERDLTITTPKGYNWIVFDEFHNCYDACKDGSSNFIP